jgi:hypothetical protein
MDGAVDARVGQSALQPYRRQDRTSTKNAPNPCSDGPEARRWQFRHPPLRRGGAELLRPPRHGGALPERVDLVRGVPARPPRPNDPARLARLLAAPRGVGVTEEPRHAGHLPAVGLHAGVPPSAREGETPVDAGVAGHAVAAGPARVAGLAELGGLHALHQDGVAHEGGVAGVLRVAGLAHEPGGDGGAWRGSEGMLGLSSWWRARAGTRPAEETVEGIQPMREVRQSQSPRALTWAC